MQIVGSIRKRIPMLHQTCNWRSWFKTLKHVSCVTYVGPLLSEFESSSIQYQNTDINVVYNHFQVCQQLVPPWCGSCTGHSKSYSRVNTFCIFTIKTIKRPRGIDEVNFMDSTFSRLKDVESNATATARTTQYKVCLVLCWSLLELLQLSLATF